MGADTNTMNFSKCISPNIIRSVDPKTVTQAGKAARSTDIGYVYKLLVSKLEKKRPV